MYNWPQISTDQIKSFLKYTFGHFLQVPILPKLIDRLSTLSESQRTPCSSVSSLWHSRKDRECFNSSGAEHLTNLIWLRFVHDERRRAQKMRNRSLAADQASCAKAGVQETALPLRRNRFHREGLENKCNKSSIAASCTRSQRGIPDLLESTESANEHVMDSRASAIHTQKQKHRLGPTTTPS